MNRRRSPRVSESKLHFKRNMEIFSSAECKSSRHPNKLARHEDFNKKVQRATLGSNECALAPAPLLSPSDNCSASGTCIRPIGYSEEVLVYKTARFQYPSDSLEKWPCSIRIHLKDVLMNNITELSQQHPNLHAYHYYVTHSESAE